MDNKTGYKQIADELRSEIISGSLEPGKRLPPERELCGRWNVERTTLRRALAVLAEEGLIGKKSGYGSIVKSRSHDLISFIATGSTASPTKVAELEHHFMSPVCDRFAALCGKNGYREISVTLTGNADGQFESFKTLLDSSRALVLADNIPRHFLEAAKRAGKPCVMLSQCEKGFRSVLCNNDNGLLHAVDHLFEHGHRNIAFLGGNGDFLNSKARADGFRRAMQAHGLEGHAIACGWGDKQGEDGLRKLLAQNPDITAVCCVNDQVAQGACRAAEALNRKIGVDFSVIGFGDTLNQANAAYRITSIRISPDRVARELWCALQWEMEYPFRDPATVLVEAELVVRETTGPLRKL